MVVRSRRHQAVKAARKESRAKLGKLGQLIIARRTLKRYECAASHFFAWAEREQLRIQHDWEIDDTARKWVEECWSEGEPLSLAGDTLSALQHFTPALKGQLASSWRWHNRWRINEVPNRAPPLARHMLEAMCLLAIEQGNYRLAALLLIGF